MIETSSRPWTICLLPQAGHSTKKTSRRSSAVDQVTALRLALHSQRHTATLYIGRDSNGQKTSAESEFVLRFFPTFQLVHGAWSMFHASLHTHHAPCTS